MAKLALGRLVDWAPGRGLTPLRDLRTTADYDRQTAVLKINVTREASIVATYVPLMAGLTLDTVVVDIPTATISTLATARLNRLMDGLDWPHVETYHRTGKVVLRVKGAPRDLPAIVTIRRDHTTGAYESRVLAQAITNPTTVAGSTVTQTTTPAGATITVASAPVAPIEAPVVAPVAPTAPVKVAPAPARPANAIFTYPTRATTPRITRTAETQALLDVAWIKHTVMGESVTISLVGPAGTGKTSLMWDWAAEKGIGVFVVDCAGFASMSDVVGTTALITDQHGNSVTRFVPTTLIEAIRRDGIHGDEVRVVVLDEFNRSESSAALNVFMPIFTSSSIYIPEYGARIEVSQNVIFAATMNRGAEYNATVALDEALVDRLQTWIKVDYLSRSEEVVLVVDRTGIDSPTAGTLVDLARAVRDAADRRDIVRGISTRKVLEAAKWIKAGLSVKSACIHVWVNAYQDAGGPQSDAGVVGGLIESTLP